MERFSIDAVLDLVGLSESESSEEEGCGISAYRGKPFVDRREVSALGYDGYCPSTPCADFYHEDIELVGGNPVFVDSSSARTGTFSPIESEEDMSMTSPSNLPPNFEYSSGEGCVWESEDDEPMVLGDCTVFGERLEGRGGG
jgi:hypothetical protein